LKTDGELSLSLEYFRNLVQSQVDSNNKPNASFAFVLQALSIFEFSDLDGVAGYQQGTVDRILGSYNLSALGISDWKDLRIEQADIVGLNNQTFSAYYVVAETVDQVLSLRFLLAGSAIKVGNIQLSPESMKIDVIIRWFNANHVRTRYTTGPSSEAVYPNSSIGISFALAAQASGAIRLDNNPSLGSSNPSINFNGTNGNGFYSWEKNATRNNGTENSDVHADLHEADDNDRAKFDRSWVVRVIHFSFSGNRPAEVTWDPEYGRASSLDTSSPSATSSSSSTSTTDVNSASNMQPWIFTILAIIYLAL